MPVAMRVASNEDCWVLASVAVAKTDSNGATQIMSLSKHCGFTPPIKHTFIINYQVYRIIFYHRFSCNLVPFNFWHITKIITTLQINFLQNVKRIDMQDIIMNN